MNVLGFNFSSTSARIYSLNCIVHSQLLPIYSANAFCTNKLNQFNCPRGEGGGEAKLICAFVCQSEKYEILVSKFLEHFICICYYFVGLPVAVAIHVEYATKPAPQRPPTPTPSSCIHPTEHRHKTCRFNSMPKTDCISKL